LTFKILNLEPEDYSDDAYSIIDRIADIDDGPLSRAELIEKIGDYDGIIVRLGHKIDEEVLSQASRLRVIVSATTGLNHIDQDYAEQGGIKILSLRGERDFLRTITATAEHTMGLMLSLIRHIIPAHCDVLSGAWNRDDYKGIDLDGKTLGIIGYGRLGSLVAGYAKVFGMKVLACDIIEHDQVEPGVNIVSMDDVLSQSDVISVHVSYSSKTHHLIDQNCFDKMKNGVFFINTARGEIVEESALVNALRKKKIAGAAVDVIADENSKNADWVLENDLVCYAKDNSNLIITPHIGGATYDSMSKTEIFMAQKLKKHIEAITV